MAFTHLHLHTEFSLLDGACKISRLVQKLKSIGQTSCAITDHGAIYGAVEFYNACKKEGIKPIIGCECYICEDRHNKTVADREYNHLILLCKNEVGYKNLSKLISFAFTDGFYYKPRIDYKLLAQYGEGLICLSACIFGKLPQLILKNKIDEAKEHIAFMQNIFGQDNYYVEIMNHGLQDELKVLPQLVSLARECHAPIVATNDCHYIEKEDALAQEVLMCINMGKHLADDNHFQMGTNQLYVKTEDEMKALFSAYPEAVENTQKIAQACQYDFDFNTKHLPSYPITTNQTPLELLTSLCLKGLKEKYPNHQEQDEPYKRLMYEIDMIHRMGYVDYFLIVWDFIHFAKTQGIPVGPGRGSGAGSIVAYTLGITGLDPLKYNLLFERFLNPERLSMPDLDIDFCYERRQEVIDYVTQKYGVDHVAQIITFGTMAARAVIRDVGRVLGVALPKVDKVAKMIPSQLGITLDLAFSLNPDLVDIYQNDAEVKRLIDLAKLLEGMPRNTSTHAAGVLISSKPITDIVPVQKNDDIVTTQFPMTTIEQLGLLKMDFLGLRTLTVVKDTLSMLPKGAVRHVDDIPIDDPNVYTMIAKGDTMGVFQLESSGMRAFLHAMKPERFEDIIAALSLYRPGPMDSIPKYIKGKQNPQSVTYLTPQLKPILEVTYGCIVYQEQVMQIVRDLAGYSMGRSDLVRRAMAKKKHDVMEKERAYFVHGIQNEQGETVVEGCVKRGINAKIANQIFDDMSSFASYAFNKSHAAAYGLLSVQTAYLKCYYPVEFMASILNSFMNFADQITLYIQYCKMADIGILPPSINHSLSKFTVVEEKGKKFIRFGLAAIKNVGHLAVDDIITERQHGLYATFEDFLTRTDFKHINKRMVESFIKAGAFDTLEPNRAKLLYTFEEDIDKLHNQNKKNVQGQMSFFGLLETEQTKVNPSTQIEDFPLKTKLNMEKEITGIYISGHPLDEYKEQLKHYDTILEQLDIANAEDKGISQDGKKVVFAGVVIALKKRITKKGDAMLTFTLEDLTAQVHAVVFPKLFSSLKSMVEVDALIEVSGRMAFREDEPPKIVVDNIKPLSSKSSTKQNQTDGNATETLYLRILSNQVEELQHLLKTSKGKTPVYAKLSDTNKTIAFHETYWCHLSDDFIDELIEHFGMENIVIQ